MVFVSSPSRTHRKHASRFIRRQSHALHAVHCPVHGKGRLSLRYRSVQMLPAPGHMRVSVYCQRAIQLPRDAAQNVGNPPEKLQHCEFLSHCDEIAINRRRIVTASKRIGFRDKKPTHFMRKTRKLFGALIINANLLFRSILGRCLQKSHFQIVRMAT